MTKHNAANERIKRRYFAYLKEAKRHSEATVDAAAKALHRLETYTRYREFKTFHFEQAIAFKKQLAEQRSEQSGERLSKATVHATLSQLKRFSQWLAFQPGFKSQFQYSDADYLSEHPKAAIQEHLKSGHTFRRIVQDIDSSGRVSSLSQHGECLEGRKETANHNLGTTGMVSAKDPRGHASASRDHQRLSERRGGENMAAGKMAARK